MFRRRFAPLLCSLLVTLLFPSQAPSGEVSLQTKGQVLAQLDAYKPPAERAKGKIQVGSSAAVRQVAQGWSENLRKQHPHGDITIAVDSPHAVAESFLSGKVEVAVLDRRLTASEKSSFVKKHGHAPIELPVGIGVTAIIVQKDNPVVARGITLPQLEAIYSSNRRLGLVDEITTWGELGLQGDWARKTITPIALSRSGSSPLGFRRAVLAKGSFHSAVKVQASSGAVARQVSSNQNAIGYAPLDAFSDDARVVPLAVDKDAKFVQPTVENIYAGEYPLVHLLWLYVDGKRDAPSSRLKRELLSMIFSRNGQKVVVDEGFYPMNKSAVRRAHKVIGAASQGDH